MITVTKEIRFEAAHRLRFHKGACRNIHGHSYLLRVTVSAMPKSKHPDPNMVIDFGVLKKVMLAVTHGEEFGDLPPIQSWDHSVILHEDDYLAAVLRVATADQGEPINIVRLTREPTVENMVEIFAGLFDRLLAPLGVEIEKVGLWETATSYAVWDRMEPT